MARCACGHDEEKHIQMGYNRTADRPCLTCLCGRFHVNDDLSPEDATADAPDVSESDIRKAMASLQRTTAELS